MKIFIFFALLISLASCGSIERYENRNSSFKERGLAGNAADDFSSEHFVGIYRSTGKSKNGALKKFRLNLSPFGGSVSFRSRAQMLNNKGKEIENEMDCRPNAESTGWVCRSGCEGGYIVIRFNRGTKLDRVQVQPFRIKMCSGNEPHPNGTLESKTVVNLTLQSLRLEK